MSSFIVSASRIARVAWEYVRSVIGDNAYERYVELSKRRGTKPLSAQEFYLDTVQRRYSSSVSRCC